MDRVKESESEPPASSSSSSAAGKLEEEVGRVMDQARELHESGASLLWKISNEEQSLRQKAISLESSIRRVRSSINSLISKKLLDPKCARKLEEDLQRASSILTDGEAAAFLPAEAQGRFLRMFLGPINVRASRKEVQLKVKEEYNSYRDRTAFLFLLFPLTLLILKSWIWEGCLPAFPVQLYEAWLLFLYTGLAMRENILRANGSDIRPWWIYHHYCAMLMALVSLTWEIKRQPNCAQKQRGVELFLQWAMMQGVAMLLQNRYQRQRLYTRIALGKANRMDVVWGETSGVDGQLWVLCPILFAMQGFEAYVGLLLLKTAFVGVVTEWQVICCGILLVLMAVGNFINTIQTLVTKSRFKAKMKRSKSKPELD
ncbi:transmembrane protein 120-like protein isoform X1 [Gossypium australe]|uniref:Transmembrane protein 120-like protein isoform X1 n=1 Tax=Gossypium australe TaxID=47621 RepID=A0A5B6W4N3_9ROSI|nr:transmembrane protein 120-like protein isoform X1 [Gossypium australe]